MFFQRFVYILYCSGKLPLCKRDMIVKAHLESKLLLPVTATAKSHKGAASLKLIATKQPITTATKQPITTQCSTSAAVDEQSLTMR